MGFYEHGVPFTSKKILLVSNGAVKAFFGPIDPQVPASILQIHPEVTVIFNKKLPLKSNLLKIRFQGRFQFKP